VKSRPAANPTNRFHDVGVTYEDGEGPPRANVKLIEDHSRSILAHNDSPDVGFNHSVNPYRGCLHACSYCISGDTPILMADGRTCPMAELQIGDEILGTYVVDNKWRKLKRTTVLDKWSTRRAAYKISLSDGTELVASGDHRFLSNRGWKHVLPSDDSQRPHLTPNNWLIGFGKCAKPPEETVGYKRGYLSGMIHGDGMLFTKEYVQLGRKKTTYQFRLALADVEALTRSKQYLADCGVSTRDFVFQAAHGRFRTMFAIRSTSKSAFLTIKQLIEIPSGPSGEWQKGFLAGIFDAEGTHSEHIFRISNCNYQLLEVSRRALDQLGFNTVYDRPRPGTNLPVHNLRLRGGIRERLRFFHTTNPAITRKWELDGRAIKESVEMRVLSIEPVGTRQLFDITTGTGDFIANGVVSHNCFARPSHEYLDMGAGTDFDTKIVVKPHAAELLREAFDKPSWKGELVMFSGVTDCYQAVESQLELTKQCLEVCLEYRNPVAIITKSALIERDLDLIVELHKQAGVHLSMSIAWVDPKLARALEPWAPAPERRFKVIEKFAAAGVPVGVMCAPIMPGLNDDQMVRVLERAKAAGAQTAGWVLLRLPGAVATVFEERVREALPLAADKIMHLIRETRGGEKLYDPRWHKRGRGEGVYAQTIATMFETTVKRLGLNGGDDRYQPQQPTRFARPEKPKIQLSLF
jgi:DNA repair photolyase